MAKEPFREIPNNAQAPRCQATTRKGEQCRMVANTGFRVCKMHGAGTHKRVASDERKPPGRPVRHGLYSKRGLTSINTLRDEINMLEA